MKEAIFARYDLTPDVYRKKFRACRKTQDETFVEWGIRATKYFERWVINANDYEELSQMMIIDQILSNTTPEYNCYRVNKAGRDV